LSAPTFGRAVLQRSSYEASSPSFVSQAEMPFSPAAALQRALRSFVTRMWTYSEAGLALGGWPLGRFLGCFMGRSMSSQVILDKPSIS
jgi:hypothetical protein